MNAKLKEDGGGDDLGDGWSGRRRADWIPRKSPVLPEARPARGPPTAPRRRSAKDWRLATLRLPLCYRRIELGLYNTNGYNHARFAAYGPLCGVCAVGESDQG